MDRIFIYIMAAADILIGFLIFYRGTGRFGWMTYKSFLDRKEKKEKKRKFRP